MCPLFVIKQRASACLKKLIKQKVVNEFDRIKFGLFVNNYH